MNNKESSKMILTEINIKNRENTEKLCRVLTKSNEESAKQPRKVIKPAKVPAWSKEISLENFESK